MISLAGRKRERRSESVSFNCEGKVRATCSLESDSAHAIRSFEVLEPYPAPARVVELPRSSRYASATRSTSTRVFQYYTCGLQRVFTVIQPSLGLHATLR